MLVPLGPRQVMRVYGGQTDPRDAARFTVKYEVDNAGGTIEGKVVGTARPP